MAENLEHLDSLIQEAEEGLESADEEQKPQFEEKFANLNSLKEEFGKSKEISNNQRIRAEKAEEELKKLQKEAKDKEVKPEPPKIEEGKLSESDLLYIAKADVHSEDIDELRSIAKTQGKSVKEVHQFGWVKSFLTERQEERKTAEAAATKPRGRGTSAPSGEDLLGKAEKEGIIPDKAEDIDKLAEARLAKKAGKK